MSQRAVSEQLRKHEQLTRKIQGTSAENSEEEYNLETLMTPEEAMAKGLEGLEQVGKELEGPTATSGLFAMKFMQRASDKQKKQNMEEVAKAEQEFRDYENGVERDEEQTGVSTGRHTYALQAKQDENVDFDFDPNEGETVVQSSGNLTIGVAAQPQHQPLFPVSFEDDSFLASVNSKKVPKAEVKSQV
jgi:Utp14 protein